MCYTLKMCYFVINNNHNGKLSYGKKKKMYMYFIGKEKKQKMLEIKQ